MIHRLPIINWSAMPDINGHVYFEPYDIANTNKFWARTVLVLDDTSSLVVMDGGFTIPDNYVGQPRIVIVWTAKANTGTVYYDFQYSTMKGDDSESLDTVSAEETLVIADEAPSVIHNRLAVSAAMTEGANIQPGDQVQYKFGRDGANPNDDMADAALVFELLFEYSDT